MLMPPAAVLAAYPPAVARRAWMPVGGGYSGADVWKGLAPDGSAVALKAWPADTTPDRVRTVHGWQAAAAELPFVPRLVPAPAGGTFVDFGERLWELSTWLVGVPDARPPDERLT